MSKVTRDAAQSLHMSKLVLGHHIFHGRPRQVHVRAVRRACSGGLLGQAAVGGAAQHRAPARTLGQDRAAGAADAATGGGRRPCSYQYSRST